MTDIKKVVPPADYSAQDFLSTDYTSTAEEQVIITESVNYVKIVHNVRQVTESIGITEATGKSQELVRVSDDLITVEEEQPIAARTLSRESSDDQIAITETVNKVLAGPPAVKQVSDTITITEQVNWLLQEAPAAPPMSSGMYLSPSARRRFPKYKAPELVVQETLEAPPLLTKVTSKRRFVYSIADAVIFQEQQAIKQALEQIKQYQEEKAAKAESNEMRQELVKPALLRAEDESLVATADHIDATPSKTEQVEKSSSLEPEQKLKVRSAIKMRYETIPTQTTKIVSTVQARYNIKNGGAAYQKAVVAGKLLTLLDIAEMLDSIDI